MTKDKDSFDWNEAADAGNLVVPEQKAIAVYWNPNGAAVIRQQGDYMLDNEDPFIVVQPGQLPSLIKRLEEMMHEGPPDET